MAEANNIVSLRMLASLIVSKFNHVYSIISTAYSEGELRGVQVCCSLVEYGAQLLTSYLVCT